MKKMFFEKELSLEFINRHIREKGIAAHEDGENGLSFKLYELDWHLLFEQGRLSISVDFDMDSDFDMPCMMRAMNKVNAERYIVKAVLQEFIPEDDEGRPVPGARMARSIAFSFETLCFTESAFEKVCGFSICALTAAIDFHCKLYAQYLEEGKANAKDVRIFNKEHDGMENSDATTATKGNRRNIGFIQ